MFGMRALWEGLADEIMTARRSERAFAGKVATGRRSDVGAARSAGNGGQKRQRQQA